MRQVIALGGGGFSMEPENPLLDRYILQQCKKENPKICFIGTASGDSEGYIERFYNFFKLENCQPTHLSLFKPQTRDIKKFILSQDIIYVGGGNTKNLMILWREWQLDGILRQAYEKGIILAGLSAGALCWFDEGMTDSLGSGYESISCLGIIQGSHCPHYDGEDDRGSTYRMAIQDGKIGSGFAADDGVALHYIDGEMHQVVSSRPDAQGYRVDKDKETKLPTLYLGEVQ